NQLAGNGGNDVISGQGGDDIISVSDGAATVRGGSGNDEFSIYEGNIFNDDNRHELYGEGGNDRFYSDLEVDSSTVYGGSGDDVVSAFAGDLYGQAGNDTVNFSLDGSFVGSHSQIIDGGSDSDHLTLAMSGVGARITLDLIANDGRRNTSDACNVRYFEWLTSGHRADLLDASLSTQGVRLDGNGDNDTLIGSNYADSLYGGEFHDSIQGNGGDDLLDGGTGNDKLIGGLGIDTYFGGSGNDTISAADGLADIIDGGDGTDEADIDEGLDQTIGVEVLT
ncbi:MAG TPA: calcium-binding protein, partial [Tepidisphaeraceae bacterium]|nr:calcium-binding protein [Tepidisphaeraceae bacterium]